MTIFKRLVPAIVVLAALLVLLACAAAPAFAESPWWRLESNAAPTYLRTGRASQEVQELAVIPPVGFGLTIPHVGPLAPRPGEEHYEFLTEPYFATRGSTFQHPLLANEANLQKALVAVSSYGPGTVVTESPIPPVKEGELPGVKFTITTPGPVQPLEFSEEQIFEEGATESEHFSNRVVKHGSLDGQIVVSATNLGDRAVEAASSPVTITDRLPAGVEVAGVSGNSGEAQHSAGEVSCSEPKPREVQCTYEGTLPSYEGIKVVIGVDVTPGAHPETALNEASVSGGGAPSRSLSEDVIFSERPVPFGFEKFATVAEEAGGATDTQAGSHPFQVTGAFTLNQVFKNDEASTPQLAKDIASQLPPGLIGNPSPFPRCPQPEFLESVGGFQYNACAPQTAVGVAIVTIQEPQHHLAEGATTFTDPIFNLQPEEGEPARFGFLLPGSPVYLDASVRSGRDYGVTLTGHNISQTAGLLNFKLVFWGVPGSPAHDGARGNDCLRGSGACSPLEATNPPPFLSLPASCQVDQSTGQPQPLRDLIEGDSWLEPGKFVKFEGAPIAALDGCNRLPFTPEIKVEPNSHSASTASGMTVDVHVPQQEALNAIGVAPAEPRNITVALPPGVAVNPSGGDGLEACSQALVGFEGFDVFNPQSEPGASTTIFSPYLPGSIPALAAISSHELAEGDRELQPGVNFCPNAAKIGNVKIKTPILPKEIEGSVYVATQNQNPFSSLLAIYSVAEDKEAGVLVKLAGKITLCKGAGETVDGMTCAAAGQLITRFENSPQAPFEDARFEFYGGERAPLATPASCGAYTTQAAFTSWSAKPGENEAQGTVHASSTFNITSGPNGTPCPSGALPFSPSLTGGSTNINAGAFTPLTTTISRVDGQQNMRAVQINMPLGLEGLLSTVKLCPEAQANEGTCGPESQIGETTVSAGVGSDPVTVKGGRVYITEKYAGAPFGLSIVNPVKAGPFDLEHDTSPEDPGYSPACDCVVVRARIDVNPQTAQLTITTDSSGPHAIPQIIDGVPVQIKKVNVLVNREHFTFNPTNCDPSAMTGSLAGYEGATSPLSLPFQVTNCAVLKYTPTLAVSTAAKASKSNGASLHFRIAYPKGAMGSQSWMKFMKFDIPKQLPARLTTIQKACLATTFEHNRGACPPASIIGHVLVHTPVLPVPLEGPLYFVSYGGTAFPDAVAVIKGYGITIESHGKTFINGKTGVTSATFESVPDVPFESIEVTVPQGPFSEFGANLPAKAKDNFCGQKLIMPIRFKAQNGLEITQNTPVGVTGCKTLTRKQKLAAALKACHKKKNRGKRHACERAARKAYGAKKAGAKKSTRRK